MTRGPFRSSVRVAVLGCALTVGGLFMTAAPAQALTRDVFDIGGSTSLCPNNTSFLLQVDLQPTVNGPTGPEETGVELRTISGYAGITSARLQGTVTGGGGCAASTMVRVTIRFVDMNAPGFNAGNPASWVYRRIPWITGSPSGDGSTPYPPYLVQLRAFRDIGEVGLIGTCGSAGGSCEFTDPLGQGIGELAFASNASDSILDELIPRVTQAASTPVGSNVSVTSGVATMTFPSVTAAGVSGSFEWPANPIVPALPGGLYNCDPTRFYTVETTATSGASGRTVCIQYPGSCNENGIALYHYHQVGWTPFPQQPVLGWDNATTSLNTSTNVICAGPNPPNGFAVSFNALNRPFAVVSTNAPCGAERCDGVDNDCDTQIDEGFDVGAACSAGIGQCARPGSRVCSADGLSSICNATPGTPTAELCNGLDDDCDTLIDDGFPVGTSCSVGIGQCARIGSLVCNASGSGTVCNASPGVPVAEVCNGLDDDCDGTADDGNPGGGASCDTGIPGVCAAGTLTCSAASLVCSQTVSATTEVCNDLDDDCDGTSDEGASDAPTWYRDADGDTFGTSATTLAQCDQPVGYVANSSDCDDTNPLLQNCNTPVSPDPVTFDDPDGYASVTLPNVTAPGETTVSSGLCAAPPEGILLTFVPLCVDIDTTATFEGEAEVCIFYDDTGLTLVQEQNLQMVRCPAGQPCQLLPASRRDTDTNELCAMTTGFSGFAVGTPTDGDTDFVPDLLDNCPTIVNFFQEDGDADSVGDVCDNCVSVSNPRVATGFLTSNGWATLTGGQRDDDHDGYGNRCDAKFPGVAGTLVGAGDLTQFRASNGKNRTVDTCGTGGTRPCAIFDLDEGSLLIGTSDLGVIRALNGKAPGPKCPTCPLACVAGVAGTCGPIP